MAEELHQFEADVEEAEEVVRALLLGGGQGPPGESRQVLEDPFADMGGEIVEPPTNPLVWAAAMVRNTRLHRATFGFGKTVNGRSGKTGKARGDTVLLLDPMEWLRRVTHQIPAPRSHLTRFYGAYSNRLRKSSRAEDGEVTVRPVEDGGRQPKSRASWARLLKMVFVVDPLTCPRCGSEMVIVSVITTPVVIDRILRHVRNTGKDDLWGARAPPPAA